MLRRDRLSILLGTTTTTVIVGTAGYGKTTLLASWFASDYCDSARAWLTLDSSDTDPTRLCDDLVEAFRRSTSPSLAASMTGLDTPPVGLEPVLFLDAVCHAVGATREPVALVLDDAHALARSAGALAVLDHLLAWSPPNVRILLACRAVPPIRLQRLRLGGRVSKVDQEALAFTAGESDQLAMSAGAHLSGEDLSRLDETTQGWPAAVGLSLLASRDGNPGAMTALAGEAIADYLTTEVLASLEPELRDFVIEGSLDDVVCPRLVDATRGRTDSAELMSRCEERGLFLRQDTGRQDEPWFRWHNLFSAHMRRRQESLPTDVARGLHRRAAQWWRPVDTAASVRHAIAADEPDLASEILAESWLEMVLTGRGETVLSAVRSVPPHSLYAAELHLASALVNAQQGDVALATLHLRQARAEADRKAPPEPARFDVRAAAVGLIVGDQAAVSSSLLMGEQLMQRLDESDWIPDPTTYALVKLGVGKTVARLQMDPREARRLVLAAAAAAHDAGLPGLELAALAESCTLELAVRDLEGTRRTAEGVLATASAKGWAHLPSLVPATAFLGWLAHWQGDSRRGRELLQQARDVLLTAEWALAGFTVDTHARACLALGDRSGAGADVASLREMERMGVLSASWLVAIDALEAEVHLAAGALSEAEALTCGWSGEVVPGAAVCTRARVLLHSGRAAEAVELVGRVGGQEAAPVVASAFVLRALGLAALGKVDDAHHQLELALREAEPSDLVQPFLWDRLTVLPLALLHAERGTAHPELLARVTDRLCAHAPVASTPWGQTLTPRERTILHYLSTDLTNSEIAAAEFISLNTAKTHIARIYRKLGVDTRRAAVRRAIELDLR